MQKKINGTVLGFFAKKVVCLVLPHPSSREKFVENVGFVAELIWQIKLLILVLK